MRVPSPRTTCQQTEGERTVSGTGLDGYHRVDGCCLVFADCLLEETVFVRGCSHSHRHGETPNGGLVDLKGRREHPALGDEGPGDVSHGDERLDVDGSVLGVEVDDPTQISDVNAV